MENSKSVNLHRLHTLHRHFSANVENCQKVKNFQKRVESTRVTCLWNCGELGMQGYAAYANGLKMKSKSRIKITQRIAEIKRGRLEYIRGKLT